MPSARVYIDGFGLYYGALKGKGDLWLDVCQLADHLLPNNEVLEVRYYASRDSRPESAKRQEAYLGALQAHDPRFVLIEIDPWDPVRQLGEDLLASAKVRGPSESALIVTDDARLVGPIGDAWDLHQHSCGVATPSGHFNAQIERLLQRGTWRKRVRRSMLIQLPESVGGFSRPPEWL